jgi:hypothetical protein
MRFQVNAMLCAISCPLKIPQCCTHVIAFKMAHEIANKIVTKYIVTIYGATLYSKHLNHFFKCKFKGRFGELRPSFTMNLSLCLRYSVSAATVCSHPVKGGSFCLTQLIFKKSSSSPGSPGTTSLICEFSAVGFALDKRWTRELSNPVGLKDAFKPDARTVF